MKALIGRLTEKKDFDNVFKNGQSSFDKILGVKVKANNLSVNRYGIIVSSKVSKLAVSRNKIRRRLREIIKQSSFPKSGFDIVIITLPPIKEADYKMMRKSIIRNFEKLAYIK